MPGDRLTTTLMCRRAAQEIRPGEVVAVGPGAPTGISSVLPNGSGVWLLSDSGAVGYLNGPGGDVVDVSGPPATLIPGAVIVGSADFAAMLAGSHVGLALIETAEVSYRGDFVHWTTAESGRLAAPGPAVDMARAGRVIALAPGVGAGGPPRLVKECLNPTDGRQCVSIIISDVGSFRVVESGLELFEVAPGWTADELIAAIGAPIGVSTELREMTFAVPTLHWPNKVYATAEAAVSDIPDGAVVNVDGFGGPGGMAHYLMVALRDQGAKELTIISNTAGIARVAQFGAPEGVTAIDHTIFVENGQVAKAIASYPVSPSMNRPTAFERAYLEGQSALEVSPQGTLAERLRSGGAGVAAFYTPTAAGTLLGDGKETAEVDGRPYVLESRILADYCIIRGHIADTLGNMVYKGTSRNFNPVMATAARTTIVEVDEIVNPGELDPEAIVTPGVFVDRIVKRPTDFSPYL